MGESKKNGKHNTCFVVCI